MIIKLPLNDLEGSLAPTIHEQTYTERDKILNDKDLTPYIAANDALIESMVDEMSEVYRNHLKALLTVTLITSKQIAEAEAEKSAMKVLCTLVSNVG